LASKKDKVKDFFHTDGFDSDDYKEKEKEIDNDTDSDTTTEEEKELVSPK